MPVSQNLLLIIAGFGILQAILLCTLLISHPKSDRSVGTFLGLHILFTSIPMFVPLVEHWLSWQYVLFVDPFLLLIGPSLLFYILSFRERITLKIAWPHLILFVLFIILGTSRFTILIDRYPVSNAPPAELINNPVMVIRTCIRIAQMALYYYFANRALNSYQQSITQLFSETSRISLSWVRWLNGGYLFLLIASILAYAVIVRFPEHFRVVVLINTAIVTPYIYLAAFKGLTQPSLWQVRPDIERNVLEEEFHQVEQFKETEGEERTERLGQNKEKTDALTSRILALMEHDKLYQESELSLQQLAARLEAPAYLVSQAINEGLQKTFYDLVNGYRVDEAKRLLLDANNLNYKVLSVGFEAGFNSKTTFNTVFKKFTGFSPTEFRELHRTEVSA